MLHFPGAGDATAAALELVQRAPEAGLPQARVGIEAGRLVFRDGDYYGRTVITAARITDYARPGEVLVSEAAAAEIGDEAVLEPLGPVRLRGLREPVALSRARRP
jgi:adenylate cyclase